MADPPPVVIRALMRTDGDTSDAGKYLASYDLDVPPGTAPGAVWTSNLDDALVFDHGGLAFTVWRSASAKYPRRPWDGKPNRPLTAWTVEFLPLDVARAARTPSTGAPR